MRLVVGATLPGAEDFLPSPEEVVRHTSESSIRTFVWLNHARSGGVVRLSGSSGHHLGG